jgi:hypothetical protein
MSFKGLVQPKLSGEVEEWISGKEVWVLRKG